MCFTYRYLVSQLNEIKNKLKLSNEIKAGVALNEQNHDGMTGGLVQAEFLKSQKKLTLVKEGIS